MKRKKSLVSQGTSVQIILPRISMNYDPVNNIHTWYIYWAAAEKQLQWTNDFFRYNPEKVAQAVNDVLKELCEISKPYKMILPTK